MGDPRFAVTTGKRPTAAHGQRAQILAERFAVPLLPRQSLATLREVSAVDVLYVVGASREELVSADGSCHVQPGLLPAKLSQGERHPFVRALRGDGDDVPAVIVDATLGLANDALHAAAATGARVVGVEKNPVLHALLEEGLARMARSSESWAEAAARIELVHGDAAEVLESLPPGSVDVVVLDPMMSRPRRAAPSFQLLRAFAHSAPAEPRLLAAAARAAGRRVILKLGKGAPLPPDRPFSFPHVALGAHVIYYVHEVNELPCRRPR